MERKNCFGYRRNKSKKYCDALMALDCHNCKFFKTKEDYSLFVEPLKYRHPEN